MSSLFTRPVGKAVGNQRHAAAPLFIQQLHAGAHCIQHADQIFAQLRVVIVYVTAVEERGLVGVLRLSLGNAFIPAAESPVGVFGQSAVMIDFERHVEELSHRFQRGRRIHQRGERGGDAAHQIRMA
ncbi:hypothetical protein D3C72_609750 [compost metagenome]